MEKCNYDQKLNNKLNILAGSLFALTYFLIHIYLKMNFSSSVFAVLVLSTICIMTFIIFSLFERNKESDMSICLLIPTIITCFQNLFLGVNAQVITNSNMSFLVVINYWYSLVLLMLLFLTRKKSNYAKKNLYVSVIIVVYSLILFVIHPAGVIAFLASFRNITSPILFLLVGILISERIDMNKYIKALLTISIVVFIFGIFERFIYNKFWIDFNIKELWEKRGIFVNKSTGKPYNHYSAEAINGRPLLRMVSTFAEPVSLGTFFLFSTIIAWFKKNYKIMAVLIVGCALTVSKGALLGIIILIVVYLYLKLKRKDFIKISIIGSLFVLAIYFYINKLGGSMAVHIQGLLSSFSAFFSNPLGYGVGNAGVYGNVLTKIGSFEVQESGIGVVIAQLGVVGLLVYGFIFGNILWAIRRLPEKNVEYKVFLYTLCFSIIALLLFNETALGPNASATFMMVLGVCTGQNELKWDERRDMVKNSEIKVKLHYIHPTNYGNLMMASSFIKNFVDEYKNSDKNNSKKIVFCADVENEEELERLKQSIDFECIITMEDKLSKIRSKRGTLSKILKLVVLPYEVIYNLKKYDFHVVLGGDCISEYYSTPRFLADLLRIAMISSWRKCFLVGQTLGPFHGYKLKLVRMLLNNCYLYTRDDKCYNYSTANLKFKEVNKSRDLAFLDIPFQNDISVQKEVLSKYVQEKKYVTIVASGLYNRYTDDLQSYINEYIKIIQYVIDIQKTSVLLLAHVIHTDESNDKFVIGEILQKIPEKYKKDIIVIDYLIMPHEARILLGNGEYTITGRMHAAVSSISMGIIPICLSYSVKYGGVIGNEFDLNEYVLECRDSEIWKSGKVSEEIINMINNLVSNKSNIIEKLNWHMKKVKELSIYQIDDIIDKIKD